MRLFESLQFFYNRLRPPELKDYKPYKPKDAAAPLSVTREYQQGMVSHWWRMLPRQFRALDRDDQAELHALYDVQREIENYYNSEHLKRADKPAATPGQTPGRIGKKR